MSAESQESSSNSPEHTYKDIPEKMKMGLRTLKSDYKIQSTSGNILVWGFLAMENHNGQIFIAPEAEQDRISLNGQAVAINTEFNIIDSEGNSHSVFIEPIDSELSYYTVNIDSI